MNWARVLISVIFVAVMVWLWQPFLTEQNNAQPTGDTTIVRPDYTAKALKQTFFNLNGQITHKVSADNMELYQTLGFTHFDKPTFTLYEDGESWQVQATTATLYENRTLILEKDVVATNLDQGALIDRIEASVITIDIDAQTMRSDQPVTLTGPGILVQGQGLRADIIADTIELIKHTRTQYHAKQ